MVSCVRFAVIIACAGLVAGCAKSPESIQAAYISQNSYMSWDCKILDQETVNVQNAYLQAAGQQRHARTSDTIGLIFLGLPVSSLSGGNIAPEIARLKGEYQAIRKAKIAKKCYLKNKK